MLALKFLEMAANYSIEEINDDIGPKVNEINDMIVLSKNCFLKKTQKIYNLFLSMEKYLPSILKYERLVNLICVKTLILSSQTDKMYIEYNKEKRFSPDEKRFIRELKRLLLETHNKCKL